MCDIDNCVLEIGGIVNSLTNNGTRFTAYDVCLLIRAAHPELRQLGADRVNGSVKTWVAPHLAIGTLVSEIVYFEGLPALQYHNPSVVVPVMAVTPPAPEFNENNWNDMRSYWIDSINYIPETQRLAVRIVNAVDGNIKEYTFSDITQATVTQFVFADSQGAYFNEFIKGQ